MPKKPWSGDGRHVHPDDAKSNFERWIREQNGPTAVSKLIDVHAVTIGLWLRRQATPSLPAAKKILDLANGQLTLEDILEGTRAW